MLWFKLCPLPPFLVGLVGVGVLLRGVILIFKKTNKKIHRLKTKMGRGAGEGGRGSLVVVMVYTW